ncbi:MAG: adenylate/guanylate cyclase domain-containing protein [Mariprofundus sp.]|nr:adenylate/guanylate cyclase domain-containing protein [Mariprofundus sp.]
MYWIIALLIVLPACFAVFQPPLIVQFLENKTYDFRFIMRGERDPGPEVVIVGIDEQSLEHIGRWPWPRATLSKLLQKMAEQEPAVIGVDILFSEPELSQGEVSLRQIQDVLQQKQILDADLQGVIQRLQSEASPDQQLGRVLLDYAHAVLPIGMLMDHPEDKTHVLQDALFDFSFMMVKEEAYQRPFWARQSLLPVDDVLDGVASLGHVFTSYDQDGVIRWEPLYVKMGSAEADELYIPSFGLEVARHYIGLDKQNMQLLAGSAVVLDDYVMSTDITGRVLINFLGHARTFKTISAYDVMQGKEHILKDKIVMLGMTALGTTDIHVTPFSRIPGVEKQAAVIENILHRNFMVKEEFTKIFTAAFIVLGAIFLVLLLPRTKAWVSAVCSVLLLIVYMVGTQYLFVYQRLWVDLMVPSGAILFLYTTMIGYRFFKEEAHSRKIRSMFSSYTTKKVVDELLEHPELALLGGTNREVTVMFSDVRSFTTFCESRTPEEVIASLNEFLSEMTDVIFAWDGTLDKFVGDEIMAFWGAPAVQEDHAALAFCCSLGMMDKITEMKKDWVSRGLEPMDIGVGLNSGNVVVGNIGCEGKKMDYTIIGDTVNLGARVEAITREYNDYLIITEFTWERLQPYLTEDTNGTYSIILPQGGFEQVHVRPLEEVKVKGKDKLVMIYEVAKESWGTPKPKT